MARMLHPETLQELLQRLQPVVPGTVEIITRGFGKWALASWTDGPATGMVAAAVLGEKKPRQRGGRDRQFNATMAETYQFTRGSVNLLCRRLISPIAQGLAVIDWFTAHGCPVCGLRTTPQPKVSEYMRRYTVASEELATYEFDFADPALPGRHRHVATLAELVGDEPLATAAMYLATLADAQPTSDTEVALPEIAKTFCQVLHLRGLLDLVATLES